MKSAIGKLRVLIVDDDHQMAKTLTDIFRVKGYHAEAACSGVEAMEKFKAAKTETQGGFDCVLTDIKMPEMNGVELNKAIKAIAPELPVVFMTACAEDEMIREGLEEGEVALLAKPLDINLMLNFFSALRKESAIVIDGERMSDVDTSCVILVVDDDPHLTKTLSDILKVKGYVPSIAPDGKTAIEWIRQKAPVAALIDLKLPDMSGLDVLREIKTRSPATECIVLTGQASQESAIKAVNLGAYSYVVKPYEVDSLLLTIARAVEKHKAEKERERLIAELEAKNTELEQFTYTVSHDLKSPLITIRGFLGVLEKEASEGNIKQLKANMTRINAVAEKMQQLLDELLELSLVGRLVNLPEEVPMENITHEAVELVAGRINDRGVQVKISPDLPIVYGDRLRLREVLQNLIDNAAKFMGDQTEPLIEIGARQDSDKTVFYVRDNGIGIEPQYHEKVFGLFGQLDPDKKGTGVGLALVKRIVQLHGGRIWVESEGPGSTFCFTLLSKSAPQDSHKVLTRHKTEKNEHRK